MQLAPVSLALAAKMKAKNAADDLCSMKNALKEKGGNRGKANKNTPRWASFTPRPLAALLQASTRCRAAPHPQLADT